ncbi:MAG TPA: hypothetical protein VF733_06050 [Candidatus Saccharimonadales bacterium]
MSVFGAERIIDQQVDEYLQYLSTYPSFVQARRDELFEQVLSHGNASIREVIPAQCVAVPAEVTREDLLDVTLGKLAAQAKRARAPFLAVIGANLTKDADPEHPTVVNNMDLIKSFQRAHPDLPLSHYLATYRSGTPVGTIKSDGFHVNSLVVAREASNARRPLFDTILTNWDADTVDATPNYFKTLQEEFAKSTTEAWSAYPGFRHSRLPESDFPNANKLLAWFDQVIAASVACSPSAFSQNLGSWALGYSFDGEAYGEMNRNWNDIKRTVGEGNYDFVAIPEMVTTSSRRLVSQLATSKYDMRYKHLYAGETAPFVEIQSDVEEDSFNYILEDLVPKVYRAAYDDHASMLKTQGIVNVEEQSRAHAVDTLRTALATIGEAYNTRAILAPYISDQNGHL